MVYVDAVPAVKKYILTHHANVTCSMDSPICLPTYVQWLMSGQSVDSIYFGSSFDSIKYTNIPI